MSPIPHVAQGGSSRWSCILGVTPSPFLETGNRIDESLATRMCLRDLRGSRAAGQRCREDVAQPCGSQEPRLCF